MTCSEVERILPEVIDGPNGSQEDVAFREHLRSCAACSELVSELRSIADCSRDLAASQDPPERVWVRISNQLRSEGLIREPDAVAPRPVLVPVPTHRWNAWWLAPVAVAILGAVSYQLGHRTIPTQPSEVAQQPATQASNPQPSFADQLPVNSASNQNATQQPPASDTNKSAQLTSPNSAVVAENARTEADLSPPASSDDQQFLSEVSQRAPSARSAYESQLRAVNDEIRETQNYIRQNPGDMDARQHLMEVYQQKAMLYQMALDRIQ